MPRPYTLFIYSLKVIPNTELERLIKERGIEVDKIDSSFFVIPPRVGNLLLYVLCLVKPPPWLWKRLLRRVRASSERQPLYPRLAVALRTLYLGRRALAHFARMDFSIFPGWTGYVFWRAGLVGLFWKRLHPRLAKPERPAKWASPAPRPAQAPGSVLSVNEAVPGLVSAHPAVSAAGADGPAVAADPAVSAVPADPAVPADSAVAAGPAER